MMERLGEVVYRVQLSAKGRKVALHRDRLALYRGGSSSPAQRTSEAPEQPAPTCSPESAFPPSPVALPVAESPVPSFLAPQAAQSQRQRRALREFVGPLSGGSS